MAQAPGHKFGQLIGNMLEKAVRPPLAEVAKKHDLYLDWKHSRTARDGRKKVTWTDSKGNSHDLDYVLEIDGSEIVPGRPKAFIEIAYRRYTKHSRNKAQEIQGAVSPLAETYSDDHPFLGAILAGEFTENSLSQLRSYGFGVLFFPFESVVRAFKSVGIDAHFDERTDDADIQAKINAYGELNEAGREKITSALRALHPDEIAEFCRGLEASLTRTISRVFVLALHGLACETQSIDEAISFIEKYDEVAAVKKFVRYEVNVRYSNGDEIRGAFEMKTDAIKFLATISQIQ